MTEKASIPKGSQIIKTIYFYLVSFVALLMIVLPAGSLLNLGVRQYVFRVGADEPYYKNLTAYNGLNGVNQEEEKRQQEEEKRRYEQQQLNQLKRDVARDVSFLIVGIPLFIFNWRLIKRNKFSA